MALIGLVHTTRLVVEPLHRVIAGEVPGADICHLLDEGILRRLAAVGSITPEIVNWLAGMVTSVQSAGAACAVVSCSSLSPCVDEVRKRVNIPVIKVDEPMMEYALNQGKRIGLVMTNPTTEAPSTLLFNAVAARLGKDGMLVPTLCPDAFARLTAGDVAGHDALVLAAIDELLERADLVMLAQISIARVKQQIDPSRAGRVLSSLDFISRQVESVLAGRTN